MRFLYRQDGFIRHIFCLGVLAIAVYSGLQFGMPYYRYSAFKSEAKETVRLGFEDVEKIRSRLYIIARDMKIPVKEKQIRVMKTDDIISVKTSWSEQVDIFGIYQKDLDFYLEVEG